MTRMTMAVLLILGMTGAALSATQTAPATKSTQTAKAAQPAQQTFASPEEAADALIDAAERFDLTAFKKILGEGGMDLVTTADKVQDEHQSKAFAEQARKKHEILRVLADPKTVTLVVGEEDWPAPMPIVERNGRWLFDVPAGRIEVLRRRIGRNELDAIEVCHGYVEAQHEYALTKHSGSKVNQYAQRIISTPGKKDGLAWKTADGKWEGPVAESIARVIEEGYTSRAQPYHGYYFKVLKGQGPAAPLGRMDFVVKGAMIGGFALAAAPASYGKTGVKSFIVSHDGVVYEKDLGSGTAQAFKSMERYNPDASWSPVEAD
ncbi:MAG TPA: DUF2950 domain-containing protein [Candidatus Polarisedimenticolia bacterium]|nr:DUF2950 domain-containing protein [Candidatus Polarisedimenticolia bacterium]